MSIPYMSDPIHGDLDEFLDQVQRDFVAGDLSLSSYHVAVGKAIAYVELRFLVHELDQYEARDQIAVIEEEFLI